MICQLERVQIQVSTFTLRTGSSAPPASMLLLLLPSTVLECTLDFLAQQDERDQAVCALRGLSCMSQLQLRIADLNSYVLKVARWRTQCMDQALTASPLPCLPLSVMRCEGVERVWHDFRHQALVHRDPRRLLDDTVLLELIARLEAELSALPYIDVQP